MMVGFTKSLMVTFLPANNITLPFSTLMVPLFCTLPPIKFTLPFLPTVIKPLLMIAAMALSFICSKAKLRAFRSLSEMFRVEAVKPAVSIMLSLPNTIPFGLIKNT